MLIKGYINRLCIETPSYLRMGVSAITTIFGGLSVTLTEAQRSKATINAPDQNENENDLQHVPLSRCAVGVFGPSC
jgi:hypothetical protein